MPAISNDQISAAYGLARQVHAGTMSEAGAVAELISAGMNRASASDYVRNFRQMLGGKPYHRTLNDAATRHYLWRILADYGPVAAQRALGSLRGHIVYYEGIQSSRRPSLRAIAAEFFDAISAQTPFDPHQLFDAEAEAAGALTIEQRSRAGSAYPLKPLKKTVAVTVFERNPYVIASVLARAGGSCELCNLPAPFVRSSNGKPYLEVHHRQRLADGGDDTVENAIAVCPNCHRKAHYGTRAEM